MLRLANGRTSYLIRGFAYGAILAVLSVLSLGLGVAMVRDEQPFRRGKEVPAEVMDFTSRVAKPSAAIVGALLGLGVGQAMWSRRRIIRGT